MKIEMLPLRYWISFRRKVRRRINKTLQHVFTQQCPMSSHILNSAFFVALYLASPTPSSTQAQHSLSNLVSIYIHTCVLETAMKIVIIRC